MKTVHTMHLVIGGKGGLMRDWSPRAVKTQNPLNHEQVYKVSLLRAYAPLGVER